MTWSVNSAARCTAQLLQAGNAIGHRHVSANSATDAAMTAADWHSCTTQVLLDTSCDIELNTFGVLRGHQEA